MLVFYILAVSMPLLFAEAEAKEGESKEALSKGANGLVDFCEGRFLFYQWRYLHHKNVWQV